MYRIVRREQFGPVTFLWDVEAPDVARVARPGHFLMVRIDETGERIPLTVADFDVERGTVTVVIQAVGKTTREMMALPEGSQILDFIGPLGLPSHIHKPGKVVLVGGGLGVAPIFPQLRAYKEKGNRTVSIIGFRNRDLMFWEDQFRKFSDELLVTTDDGSLREQGVRDRRARRSPGRPSRREGSRGHRSAPDDEGLRRSDPPVRHSDPGQPELHHGGRHRHVRLLPRDRRRR